MDHPRKNSGESNCHLLADSPISRPQSRVYFRAGFDAPGATYPHEDAQGLCSFAALVHERLEDNAVLLEMARIVQAADIRGHLDDHPAARGLQLISRGFPLVTGDDHLTAERAAFVYDSLYASIQKDMVP
jgi:hypothetical protein